MVLFIAVPIVSIILQSLFVDRARVIVPAEICGPFGCTEAVTVDLDASAGQDGGRSFGQFSGLSNYFNRNHLALDELSESWSRSKSWGALLKTAFNLPFYNALAFTLT